ncbi:MAG: RNA polymerase sigma factor [Fuerstiella sp.]
MLKPTSTINESGATGVSKVTLQCLFDSEENRLLKYAFSLVGRRAVAEEIVQDVFLQLHARWDEVDSPKAWLYRSVRNRAYNSNRASKREVLNEDHNGLHSECCAVDSVEDSKLHLEAIAAVRSSLNGLNESDRQLVKLKYFEDLKYREISDQSGLKIGNVGYRLHHILKELADKLRKLGFDGNS